MNETSFQASLLAEFLTENREALTQAEQALLHLESAPTRQEWLQTVYRQMHTVKGNCRMLGFTRLEELTHASENLLDLLRDRKLILNQKISAIILEVMDLVRERLHHIEKTGEEGLTNFAGIIQDIILLQESAQEWTDTTTTPENGDDGDDADLFFPEPLLLTTPSQPMRDTTTMGPVSSSLEGAFVRIGIDRLDVLMNLVGEMAAAFSQFRHTARTNPGSMDLSADTLESRLTLLQDEVLSYRLQPIARIWEGYHRLVRDLAVSTDKKILLETEGEETEVDRSILLAIKDPLGHLIRNAVDHGIEPPAERQANGKSPIGRIRLRAIREHGQIYMDIIDDGRGIDPDKILTKALAMGLVTPAQAMTMTQDEIRRLILMPGFTTAQEVSRISGRGAGMDAVLNAVEKVGGSLKLTSEMGCGTTIRLRIPQTMAMVASLLVVVGGETYAIPQSNIIELITCYPPESHRQIENKMGLPMLRVREHLVPLMRLDELFWPRPGITPEQNLAELRNRGEVAVVIVQSEMGQVGLMVDQITENTSLVIKPLTKFLAGITWFSGAAILPEGKVCFLLELSDLHRMYQMTKTT